MSKIVNSFVGTRYSTKTESSVLKTRINLLTFTAFLIAVFVSLAIVYGANYFVASPLVISKRILSDGNIPQRLYDVGNFWNDHANFFTNYPGSALLISILSMIGGVNYYVFAYLPVISVFWVVMLFCFVKLFSRGKTCMYLLLAFILTIFTTSIYPAVWTVNYHSLGYLSHLLIIYLVAKLLLTGKHDKGKCAFMTLLIYTVSLLNYYATSTFSIVFLVALIIWILIFKVKYKVGLMAKLLTLFFIMYIIFDVMVWDVLKYWKLDFIDLFEAIMSSINRFIIGTPASEELFQYGFPYELSLLDKWLNRIYLSFIGCYWVFVLVLIYLAAIPSIEKKKLAVLTLTSLSVAIYESFPYAIVTGGINLRYLSFFTPIITISVTGMLVSYQKYANVKKRIVFYILLVFLIIATVSSVKLNYINSAVNGLGVNKRELIQYPEYIALVSYSSAPTSVYSNFQVSGELRLASIKVGTDQSVLCTPFRKTIYSFYEAVDKRDLGELCRLLDRPSIIVLTDSDFTKPMYGDAWGYGIPPLGEQNKVWLESSTLDLVYNSERLEAFYIE